MKPQDQHFIIQLARKAGEAILKVYNDKNLFAQTFVKDDHSPLTLADQRSNTLIVNELSQAFPDIPVISEEIKNKTYEVRKNWKRFWLVDPLDGTKEFIKRNGQFTVNIALIENDRPVFGCIYIPVTNEMFFGGQHIGSFKEDKDGIVPIRTRMAPEKWIATGSSSHASPEEQKRLSGLPINEFKPVGSSIKFCLLAEGKVDFYYRHGPTMEWDIAAGEAILQGAGGQLVRTWERPHYNQHDLLNKSFFCLADGIDPDILGVKVQ